MSGSITKPERATLDRVVKLFCDALDYTYLGNLEDKTDNSNIEEPQLRQYLTAKDYSTVQLSTSPLLTLLTPSPIWLHRLPVF